MNSSDAEKKLDSFDSAERVAALEFLVAQSEFPSASEDAGVNMHQHSFFSYNSKWYSPSRIAFESRKAGLYAAGLCDFDVIDGLEEFLDAGLSLGLRATVNLETRAFMKEYASVDINSPGEPGVAYIMAAGFFERPSPGSDQDSGLRMLLDKAADRNRGLVDRINQKLEKVAIDYEKEVLPLSPGGCPTERHIVRAYRVKAEQTFGGEDLVRFFEQLLGVPIENVRAMLQDTVSLEDKLRSALAKSGGIGYVKPTSDTFPPVDDFVKWALACDVIPMVTWLDGTSAGEEDMSAMLECMQAKGACALNIIPDRNHNIKDRDERELKIARLRDVVEAARSFKMPVNIGTEMNKGGQPFVDDINCEALSPYRSDFIKGAELMVGHTTLSRFAGFSYAGEKAAAEFDGDVDSKKVFFERTGALPALTAQQAQALREMGQDKAYVCLRDSADKGEWCM